MCQQAATVFYFGLGAVLVVLQSHKVIRAPTLCGMPGIWCLHLVLLRCGEPGLDEESSLLAVSIREALLWSCLPADDSGLFTAPKTFADFGWRRKR